MKLAGTLTLPANGKPRTAAILLTGIGAQNRDEELVGFRPFRVIADHLAKIDLGVLRYDDRGVGRSTGSVPASTTHDFASDAIAAMKVVKNRLGEGTVLGLLGHSEGAIAAAIAAAETRDVALSCGWAAPPNVATESSVVRPKTCRRQPGPARQRSPRFWRRIAR